MTTLQAACSCCIQHRESTLAACVYVVVACDKPCLDPDDCLHNMQDVAAAQHVYLEQVRLLEGVQPSTSTKSGAGVGGGGCLPATQQHSPTLPNSPIGKGLTKTVKGSTIRPMGAALPVRLCVICLVCITCKALHLLQQPGSTLPNSLQARG